MKKYLKIGSISLAVLVVLVLAAVVAAPYLLNLDRIRTYGERYATETLGRKVTIEDVSFSWRGPRVSLVGFAVAEAEGFGTLPFATLSSFDLKFRIWDLLRRRIAVRHVILVQPNVRMDRNPSGRWNFDDILDRFRRTQASFSGSYAAMAPGGGTAVPLDLLVEEIRVQDGVFSFRDETNPRLRRGLKIRGANLTISDLSLDRPVRIQAQAGLLSPSPEVYLEGTLGPVGKVPDPGAMPIDLVLRVPSLEMAAIPEITGPLPVKLSGNLTSKETLRGSLGSGLSFEQEVSLLGLSVATPDGLPILRHVNLQMNSSGRFDYSGGRIALDSLSASFDRARFSGKGSLRDLWTTPVLDLSVNSEPVPLDGWDRVIPKLEGMAVLAGDVAFRGRVTGSYGRDLSADLTLSSDRFEADRGPVLLARSSSAAIAPPVGQAPPEPISPFPAVVKGKVAVRQGRFEKIPFSDLTADLSARGTTLSLDGMGLSVFGGRASGKASADLGVLPLAYSADFSMEKIQVNDALTAVTSASGVLYSEVSMDVALSGRGTEMPDLKRHLRGKGSLRGADGRLTTASLTGGAAKAASLLGIGPESEDTRFDDMTAAFTIADGTVKVSNLYFGASEWSLSGTGDIGLDQSLDMKARMTLSAAATAKIPEDRRRLFPKDEKGRAQIPLKVGGAVTSPKMTLDAAAMGQAAKQELKKETQQKIEEKKEVLKEKLQKDLGERLKKLF